MYIGRICAAAAFLSVAAAAFGEGDHGGRDFSVTAGAGAVLGGSFTRYSLSADGSLARVEAEQNVDQFDYGLFAFLDATYGTLSVHVQNGTNSFAEPVKTNSPVDVSRSGQGWETVLGFSLLVRYPFTPVDGLSVFPLLGMDYQASLVQMRTDSRGKVYDRSDGKEEWDRDLNAFRLSDWNSFHVRLGGGAEFMLSEKLSLRGDLLYGIRLMTPFEAKNLERMKNLTGDDSPTLGGLSSGPSLRLGLGWRFLTLGR